MGFFSSLFGSKRKEERRAALLLQREEEKKADLELYFELTDMIVPSEAIREKVKTQLVKAFEHPESFYDESGEYTLAIRGMRLSKNLQETPKFVFIDTLIDEGQMAEVDWKEEEAEVRTEIIIIMKAKQFPFSVSDDEQYENLHTGDVIQMIDDEELVPNGYSLQLLDIQSDNYVFTIVPLADRVNVKQIFSRLQ